MSLVLVQLPHELGKLESSVAYSFRTIAMSGASFGNCKNMFTAVKVMHARFVKCVCCA